MGWMSTSNQYIVTGETTTDGVNILADSVTTADGMDISADGLTTGSALRVVSNSSSTGTRDMVYIHNDHSSATGTTVLHVQNDSTGPGVEIVTAGANNHLSLISNDAGTGSAPDMAFWRNSASPAGNDQLGVLVFYGENDADEKTEYARIASKLLTVTDGSENGQLEFQVMAAGTTQVKGITINSGGVIVNEGSVDLDFRVESNNNISMFVVNGGDNNVELTGTGTAKGNYDILELTNDVNAADMDATGTSILWNQWYYDGSSPAIADAARIQVLTEQDWTSTASTQDASMLFLSALNGTLTEQFRITSDGTKFAATKIGFYGTTPVSKPNIDAGTIGASPEASEVANALVTLGLATVS